LGLLNPVPLGVLCTVGLAVVWSWIYPGLVHCPVSPLEHSPPSLNRAGWHQPNACARGFERRQPITQAPHCAVDEGAGLHRKSPLARKGSRSTCARMEDGGSWERLITDDLKAEIESQTSVFLATANSEGQPCIQHRGLPAGFLQVLDEHTRDQRAS